MRKAEEVPVLREFILSYVHFLWGGLGQADNKHVTHTHTHVKSQFEYSYSSIYVRL